MAVAIPGCVVLGLMAAATEHWWVQMIAMLLAVLLGLGLGMHYIRQQRALTP